MGPQILHFFKQGNLKNSRTLVATRIIGKMLQTEPLFAQKSFLKPLLKPLYLFLTDSYRE